MSSSVETDLVRVAMMARPSRLHPPYPEMVRQAVSELQDSSDSSKAAIQRYIVEHYPLRNNDNLINSNVRLALKRGVERGVLVQVSGNERQQRKTKPAGLGNKGPTSVKKSNVEKKAKTPAPVEPTTKKTNSKGTLNAVKGAKPTCARPKSIKKATAMKKK